MADPGAPGPEAADQGDPRRPSAKPAGFYRNIRQRLPVFAAVGALSVLVALIPFPHQRTLEILVAGALFFLLTGLRWCCRGAASPWFWPVIPIGYIAVIALLRDAQGGTRSGLDALYFLPIVWLAFYGQRGPAAGRPGRRLLGPGGPGPVGRAPGLPGHRSGVWSW